MKLRDPNRPDAEVVPIAVEMLQAMRVNGVSYTGDVEAGKSLLRGYDERTLVRVAVWLGARLTDLLTRRHGPAKVARAFEGWRLDALVAMPADREADAVCTDLAGDGGGDDS